LSKWTAAQKAAESALADAISRGQTREADRLRERVSFLEKELTLASEDVDSARSRRDSCWQRVVVLRNG
jgi:hypothetical protein